MQYNVRSILILLVICIYTAKCAFRAKKSRTTFNHFELLNLFFSCRTGYEISECHSAKGDQLPEGRVCCVQVSWHSTHHRRQACRPILGVGGGAEETWDKSPSLSSVGQIMPGLVRFTPWECRLRAHLLYGSAHKDRVQAPAGERHWAGPSRCK